MKLLFLFALLIHLTKAGEMTCTTKQSKPCLDKGFNNCVWLHNKPHCLDCPNKPVYQKSPLNEAIRQKKLCTVATK